MTRKLALLIGNSAYQDPTLAHLKTPEVDVEALARVLRDPQIGDFDEVTPLINQPETLLRRAIARFFNQKKRNDLLLLYFTGHGVLDDQGHLYLAAKDTEHDLPSSSAISATFITNEMNRSRSQRQVLILDCCYSGTFARGAKGPGTDVKTRSAFEGSGYGRVVLTATDETQYAWEGEQVIGETEQSVFTHYLVQGLETGVADGDQDGQITVDEWYDYVYEQVVSQTPKQVPGKWTYKEQGEIIIARNPRPVVKPVKLPDDLQQSIEDLRPSVHEGAVSKPGHLLRNSYALIIGIGAYRHIRKLNKTTTDAGDLYDLLIQSGYSKANVVLLRDQEATKALISDKLDWLARRASPEATVLFFFSGHGAQRRGGFDPGEYLCPVEADWYNLRNTAISNEELTRALKAISARRVVVFLDACHSGGVGEARDAGLNVENGLSGEAYDQLAAGEGRLVIASCQPDEVSWELPGMRNGLFTHYLLQGLRGAVADEDRAVRTLRLYSYISQQVPRHKDQHPLLKTEMTTDIVLCRAIAAVEPSDETMTPAVIRERVPKPPPALPNELTITTPIHLDLIRVPAGEFLMGSNPTVDKDANDDEQPQHWVELAEFYIGKYLVTNEQYAAFVEATGHRAPDDWTQNRILKGKENHPVVNVSWHDAVAFCEWLSRETGRPFRLPTEAEWEKSARGTDGRIYPWGNRWDKSRANTDEAGQGTTTPVDLYSPAGDSPYGLADMVGNVWEWCVTKQGKSYPSDMREDEWAEDYRAGTDNRVIRGGAWRSDRNFTRCAVRNGHNPDIRDSYVGFRVVSPILE